MFARAATRLMMLHLGYPYGWWSSIGHLLLRMSLLRGLYCWAMYKLGLYDDAQAERQPDWRTPKNCSLRHEE
jgi:hypothetical protein